MLFQNAATANGYRCGDAVHIGETISASTSPNPACDRSYDGLSTEEGGSMLSRKTLESLHEQTRTGNAVDEERHLQDDGEATVYWQFRVLASLGNRRSPAATDVIGAIAFDKSNRWFATGGIARKIRVYSFESLLLKGTGGACGSWAEGDEDEVVDGDEEEEDDEDEGETDEGGRKAYVKRRRGKRGEAAWRRRRTEANTCNSNNKGAHQQQPGTYLDHDESSEKVICTPAKLSCVRWAPGEEEVIGCGDYDGVVAEWDIERGTAVSEKDEHDGKRVWSIDYSSTPPHLCASASDDGTVRLWHRGTEKSVSTLFPPSSCPVCCAEFSPSSPYTIALASSDSNIYLFDTRQPSSPTLALRHHRRAASYVRFLDGRRLVSASTDSTLKLWDISSPGDADARESSSEVGYSSRGRDQQKQLIRTYGVHRNVRNFVGLSVWPEGGLLACGSETNEAFAYDCRWVKPVLRHAFREEDSQTSSANEPRLRAGGRSSSWGGGSMVSAVCWRRQPADCTLLAANSDGVLRILTGECRVLSP